MDFPRLVYKSASIHTLAVNQEEHDDLLTKGWHASVPEALGVVGEVEAIPAPVTSPKPSAKVKAPVTPSQPWKKA
jgi:hypothetical protein